MKQKEEIIAHGAFQELHKNKGSENYKVANLLDKKFEIRETILADIENKNIIFYSYKEQKQEKKNLHIFKKTTFLGNGNSEIENSNSLLKDGTISASDYYINWIINGDTTKHKYLDPFSNKEIEDPYVFKAKEQNPEKWLEKFKELYSHAQYVYVYLGMYYLKLDNKWYFMEAILEGLPDNLKQQYPPKEDQDVRMVELENLAPLWYHKGFKDRDTSLIKMVDYESTYYEEKGGLDSFKYSAGWWYLEVYMPLGDTIRIKRYSYFEDPELKLYKVPKEYGGREDVLFIVQKPKDAHLEQVAGMYVIRPKDPNQPQRRYKKMVYTTDAEGNEIIDRSKSVETEEYKHWKNNKK